MIRTRLLALTLLAAPLGAFPLWNAGQDGLSELLRDRAEAAAQLETAQLWAEAQRIEDLLLTSEEESADGVLDRLLEQPDDLGERGVLLLCAVRLGGDSPDYSLLTGVLRPLFGSADQGVREAAASLCDAREFSQIDVDDLRDLIEELLAGAEDIDNAPATRLAFAASAHAQGSGAVQRDARKVMRGFLESASPELRGMGALALASIGDLETARVELERLTAIPGPEGQLAAAYLKNEELKGFYEAKQRILRKRLTEQKEEEAPAEDLESIDAMIELIADRHIEGDVISREELLDAALIGMLESLDQHSAYMNTELFADFQQDLQGEYGGIGAYVGIDQRDNLFTITQPIYSGPAYEADLRTDDKIIQIDDWPTHEHGISKDQDAIIRRLKGKPDTDVKLYIWRRGMDPGLIDRPTEEMAVTVRRGFITIPTVKSELLPGGVGLIQLDQFSGVASRLVKESLEELQARGAKSIVLDLRNNPGGLLSQARRVSDLFLPKRLRVVTTESRLEDPEHLRTTRNPVVPADMPIVVLINRFSASASEIVSGALQDHGRATLVGQRSFGKGSVQHLIPVGQDDEYTDENQNRNHDNWEPLTTDHNGNGEFDYAPRAKVTIARYLLPSGRSIHRELDEEGNIVSLGGVTPELLVNPKRWEAWRLEALNDLIDDGAVRDWVHERWAANEELFAQLAFTDGKDPGRYPGFDELYDSLQTPLSEEDVRYLVRREVRRKAQDRRGSAFPRGDFQEDLQLQKGIQVAFEEQGRKAEEVPEYEATFEVEEDLTGRSVARSGSTDSVGQSRNVRYALGLIAEARQESGALSQEQLDELQRILSELDK